MTKRTIITLDQIKRLETEFMELFKDFRPQPQVQEDIEIYKRIKPALNYRRLMIKNEGNKHEKHYRTRMYNEMVHSLPALRFYLKNKQ